MPKLAKKARNSEMNPTHPAPGADREGRGSEKDGPGRSSMHNLAGQEVLPVLLSSTEMQSASNSDDASDGEDSGDMRLLDFVMLAVASSKMVVSQVMSSLATRAHTAAVQDGEARLGVACRRAPEGTRPLSRSGPGPLPALSISGLSTFGHRGRRFFPCMIHACMPFNLSIVHLPHPRHVSE